MTGRQAGEDQGRWRVGYDDRGEVIEEAFRGHLWNIRGPGEIVAHLNALEAEVTRLTEERDSLRREYERSHVEALEIEADLDRLRAELSEAQDLIALLRLRDDDTDRLRALAEEQDDDIGNLLDCIVWMSGSGDFSPDAVAGKAWAEFRDGIVKPAMERWAHANNRKPGPLSSSSQETGGSDANRPS